MFDNVSMINSKAAKEQIIKKICSNDFTEINYTQTVQKSFVNALYTPSTDSRRSLWNGTNDLATFLNQNKQNKYKMMFLFTNKNKSFNNKNAQKYFKSFDEHFTEMFNKTLLLDKEDNSEFYSDLDKLTILKGLFIDNRILSKDKTLYDEYSYPSLFIENEKLDILDLFTNQDSSYDYSPYYLGDKKYPLSLYIVLYDSNHKVFIFNLPNNYLVLKQFLQSHIIDFINDTTKCGDYFYFHNIKEQPLNLAPATFYTDDTTYGRLLQNEFNNGIFAFYNMVIFSQIKIDHKTLSFKKLNNFTPEYQKLISKYPSEIAIILLQYLGRFARDNDLNIWSLITKYVNTDNIVINKQVEIDNMPSSLSQKVFSKQLAAADIESNYLLLLDSRLNEKSDIQLSILDKKTINNEELNKAFQKMINRTTSLEASNKESDIPNYKLLFDLKAHNFNYHNIYINHDVSQVIINALIKPKQLNAFITIMKRNLLTNKFNYIAFNILDNVMQVQVTYSINVNLNDFPPIPYLLLVKYMENKATDIDYLISNKKIVIAYPKNSNANIKDIFYHKLLDASNLDKLSSDCHLGYITNENIPFNLSLIDVFTEDWAIYHNAINALIKSDIFKNDLLKFVK